MRRRPHRTRFARAKAPLWSTIIAAVGLTAATARADDTHYQDYPIGGRAVGLGGAFTALANDPSGIFYNPAGTVDATRTSVQISSNLYGLEIADTFFSAVEKVADFNTVFSELNVIPSSASFISALGERDDRGRARNSYGFGAFVPSFRGLNVRNQARGAGGCEQLGYQRSLLDRTFYLGGALARRVDDIWRAGLSGFIAYRSLHDQEETSCSSTPSSGPDSFGIAETDLNISVAGIFLAFGVKAELDYGWNLGIAVTSPSIRIYDYADVRVLRGTADPGTGESRFVLTSATSDSAELRADTKFGASLRIGVAHVVPETATFSLDVSLHAPTSYMLLTPPQDDTIRESLTIVTDVQRRFVTNINVGAEWLLAQEFSIALGAFSNLTSAPPILGEAGERFTEDRLPHINSFGGSFVLGFFSDYTLTRVGITGSYGDGTDVAPRFAGLAALGEPPEFVKIDYSQLFLYAFLSSTFRY